jgi:transposase
MLDRELETRTFPTTRRGIETLIRWARLRGTVLRAGVEGTGSYGAGLAHRLVLEGIEVFEVTRPARRGQRHRGKTDDRDAAAAARVVLSGEARATPKTRDGIVESIRVLRNTRASAVKARTQAGLQLRSLVLTAPTELRDSLRDLSTTKTVARCARWHRVDPTDATRSTRLAMRGLARRHKLLDDEVAELDTHIKALTKTAAPRLLSERGSDRRPRRAC